MKIFKCDWCHEQHVSLAIQVKRADGTWHFCNLEHLSKWALDRDARDKEFYSTLAKY